jgi:uncharacterized repeat protein (TIGR03847 family)
MMRSLGRVDGFVVGATGTPGSRTFLIEITPATGRTEWFHVEKEQAEALATRSLEMLSRLEEPAGPPGPLLSDPGEVTFRVGEIGIGTDGDEVTVLLSPREAEEGDPVAFTTIPRILDGMARRALQVVAAGRPTCPFCGLPKDPEGHTCPAGNGDLRGRR